MTLINYYSVIFFFSRCTRVKKKNAQLSEGRRKVFIVITIFYNIRDLIVKND